MNYNGTALHESFGPRGRASGTLTVKQNYLHFDSDTIHKEIPLSNLTITCENSGVRLYYFSNKSDKSLTFYTPDKSILSNPEFQKFPELSSQIKTIKKKNGRGLFVLMMVPVLFALLIGTLIVAKKPIVKQIVKVIPVEWEMKLGEAVFAQVKLTSKIVSNPKAEESIATLTKPLLEALPKTKYDFKFYIVQNSVPNAFALPGGYVVIHTGLIEKANSSEELLGVIAHEIAHVTQRHGMNQLVNSVGIFVVLQTLMGDLTGISAVILNNGSMLLASEFSRSEEDEADRIGFDTLVNANIDPTGLIDFFKTLEKEDVLKALAKKQSDKDDKFIKLFEKLEKVFAIFSTHPSLNDRIKKLEKRNSSLQTKVSFKKVKLKIETLKKQII